MRTLRMLLSAVVTVSVLSTLSACGYRTPLMLPKPDVKPPASAPTNGEAK